MCESAAVDQAESLRQSMETLYRRNAANSKGAEESTQTGLVCEGPTVEMEEEEPSPQPSDGEVDEDVEVDVLAASPLSVVAGFLNVSG